MGFGSFQVFSREGAMKRRPREDHPRDRITLQSLPLAERRTASPRPLPSRRSTRASLRAPRPQGFARSSSPLSEPGVAAGPDPMLSWASPPPKIRGQQHLVPRSNADCLDLNFDFDFDIDIEFSSLQRASEAAGSPTGIESRRGL
jgi:hypothetical protein